MLPMCLMRKKILLLIWLQNFWKMGKKTRDFKFYNVKVVEEEYKDRGKGLEQEVLNSYYNIFALEMKVALLTYGSVATTWKQNRWHLVTRIRGPSRRCNVSQAPWRYWSISICVFITNYQFVWCVWIIIRVANSYNLIF